MSGSAPPREILIVDDEPRVRELLARWLQADGYRTAQATDADAALRHVATNTPAVVVCDVHMPGKDGLWLVSQLREQHPDVAIVLATANGEVPPAISLQRGVIGYVLKPFQREQVLTTVRRAAAWHDVTDGLPPEASQVSVDEWLRAGKPQTNNEGN